MEGLADTITPPPEDVTDPAWAEWWNNNFKNLDASVKVTSASVPSEGVADMSTYTDDGGGGGGGGSEPKKTEDSRKKKSEMVERYKEVNDQLDETRDRLDDVNRSADRLWGAARIKKMREANKEIQNEIDLLKRKGREIQTNLKNDLAALQ
jgi:hypothetical protein